MSDSGRETNVIQGAIAALQSSLHECYISRWQAGLPFKKEEG
jgi:hypothetical protein